MDLIATQAAPPAGGHYSQAVVANGFIFVAGQLPLRLEGGVPDGIEAQTRQTFANVEAILKAAGSALDKVVNANIFVLDIAHWPAVNRLYSEIFGAHKPARTVTVSPQLNHGALLEVQIVALAA